MRPDRATYSGPDLGCTTWQDAGSGEGRACVRKEAKLLLARAMDSLTLSIDHFNRPWDCGRTEAVLILLDHAFELLLKAAIVHRGGRIRKPQGKYTIGFEESVRKCLTDGSVKCLNEDQVFLLQTINSLRDAAQHHLVDVSERHLYIHSQAGLILFRGFLKDVFGRELRTQLPERVLPISTHPPTDLVSLFEDEVKEISRLLQPGRRRRAEALAKLRGLAIVDGALSGEKVQPTDAGLERLAKSIRAGKSWDTVFPGVASINITANGYGPSIDLRIVRTADIQVQLVPEETPGGTTIAIRRVSELDYWRFSRDDLARVIKLSGPRTTALIRYLDLQADGEAYKEFSIGKAIYQRYSDKALAKLREALTTVDMDEVWKTHGIRWKKGM